MPTKIRANKKKIKIATNVTANAAIQDLTDVLQEPGTVESYTTAINDLKTMTGDLSNVEIEEPGRFKLPKDAPLMVSIHDLGVSQKAKTITIVAKTATWGELDGTVRHRQQEDGRLGAQVGHAVSKLKLSYLMHHKLEDQPEVANWLMNNGVTSIVLEARDSEELRHIARLLVKNNVHFAWFHDTNKPVYGTNLEVLTAVSIGPVFDWMVDGITDYLYLWKALGNPVG